MKKLKANIYIESNYSGVSVGAFLMPRRTVLVDAPLRPEEGRAWLAALDKAGANPRRLLVNLDSHPDRSLGTQTLESQVITQQETAEHFNNRAAIFKAVRQETGAVWEKLEGLNGLRWVMPQLVFEDKMQLRFGDDALSLEFKPGPSLGSSWLIAPASKVVFVGDAVTRKQASFLALADIPQWVESLDLLLSKNFSGYRIISGRGGEVKLEDVRNQRRFLKDVESRLKRLAERKAPATGVEKLVPKLMEKYKFPARVQAMNAQRLSYGLQAYYRKHYLPASKTPAH